MNILVMFLISFISALAGGILCTLIFDAKLIHDCTGMIVMSEDEMYLALSDEDKEAFKSKSFVTLRLKREKFSGFNENC